MKNITAIHQFVISLTPGDGTSNGIRFTQRLLRDAGLKSDIFLPPEELSSNPGCRSMSELEYSDNALLLVHHGIGNPFDDVLQSIGLPVFLVFHNITPSYYFGDSHPILPLLQLGWDQLERWPEWVQGVIGDSELNVKIAIDRGHNPDRAIALPLLIDLKKLQNARRTPRARPLTESFRAVFVGRFMENKNQKALVRSVAKLVSMGEVGFKLCLAGGGDDRYRQETAELARTLGVSDQVEVLGKVSDEQLVDLYESADLYVSLSKHEGFGMPLVEAMVHGVPVLGLDWPDSCVATTLGEAGLVLKDDSPESVAATIRVLMYEPGLRAAMREAGFKHVKQYEQGRLTEDLFAYLRKFGYSFDLANITSIAPETSVSSQKRLRIEGPFDSSYSLARVNRYIAEAIDALDPGRVSLKSSEGPTDFEPDSEFLASNSRVAKIANAGFSASAEVVARLMYPPRVTGMNGVQSGLNLWGWEESVIPADYIDAFNRHCTFITTMSEWVSQTLIDNGYAGRVETIGLGADHILRVEADDSSLPCLGDGLRVLHISSCFPRKGIDVLLEAYAKAFDRSDAPPATLVIKTFPNPHHDIESQLKTWSEKNAQKLNVVLINKDLGDEAIRALYEACDVLVAPSRGEGFGLPMAEAMFCGTPVITTDAGGQSEFCTETTSWLIPSSYAAANTHLSQSRSTWFEPNADALKAILLEFATAKQQVGAWDRLTSARVVAAKKHIAQKYTWAAVAKRYIRFIDALETSYGLKSVKNFGCVTTWNTKCGIATYSRLLLEPALADAIILANSTEELTAEDGSKVVRCWESGQKDELRKLYATIKDLALKQVLIQFNFSFFNLDALRELLENLRKDDIQVYVTLHSTADVYWGEELKSLEHLQPELSRVQRLFVHTINDLNFLKARGYKNQSLFPHGVSHRDDKRTLTAEEVLADHALPNRLVGKRVIASYGFLLPHKGVADLIKAFVVVAKQLPDTHLLLVNALYPVVESEQEAQRCREVIAANKLDLRVTMITDYLDDEESLALLDLAELIVYPYQYTQESSSAAVRWGVALGKPVLCTPQPIFDDVSDAVLFSPEASVGGLVAGIVDALEMSDERRAILRKQQMGWLSVHKWDVLSRRLQGMLIGKARSKDYASLFFES